MLIFIPLFLFYQSDLIGDSKPTKKVAFVDNNLLTMSPAPKKCFLTRIARIAFFNVADNQSVKLVGLVSNSF
jgi:hypothetical protein